MPKRPISVAGGLGKNLNKGLRLGTTLSDGLELGKNLNESLGLGKNLNEGLRLEETLKEGLGLGKNLKAPLVHYASHYQKYLSSSDLSVRDVVFLFF